MDYTIGLQFGDLFSAAVAIPSDGTPLVIAAPALVGRADGVRLVPSPSVTAASLSWWAGWAALGSERPHLVTSLDRMYDPAFLPALGQHLLHLLSDCIPVEDLAGAGWGAGMPARWGVDEGRAVAFGERLRGTGTTLDPLTIMGNPEAAGFGALLTDRGERAPELRGKHDLLVVEVGSDAIEIAHLNRARMVRVASIPLGIAHGLQPLRMALQTDVGPLPLCALVTALSDDPALADGIPESVYALREYVPVSWEADIGDWTNQLTALIVQQCDVLVKDLESPPPIVLGGEGLLLAPIRDALSIATGAQVVLPWYSMGLGLARHAALTARKTRQAQPGGAA